ncbi:hypothetical protein QTP70_017613, partial [Hemibagrus guttatus]
NAQLSLFVIVICNSFLLFPGQARPNARRCLCQGPGSNYVSPKRVDRIEIYPPSASCENVEVIAVLKNGAGKKCLNPESKFVKINLKKARHQRR